jgi:hypothetical protein
MYLSKIKVQYKNFLRYIQPDLCKQKKLPAPSWEFSCKLNIRRKIKVLINQEDFPFPSRSRIASPKDLEKGKQNIYK